MLQYLRSFFFKATPSGPKISVIQLNGVISPSTNNPVQDRRIISLEKVKKWADVAFEVPNVQAVVLSITCPGGAPGQTELITNYLRTKAKAANVPILSFANDVAASGGYWLMCAGDELYACKTSLVGSIGVVSPNFGFVEAMKRLGIERRLFKAGQHYQTHLIWRALGAISAEIAQCRRQILQVCKTYAGESKAALDAFSSVTEDQRKQTEDVMSCLHGSFIDTVKERRQGKLDLAKSDQLFSGQVWTGTKAKDVGLVDHIGDMDSVLQQLYGKDVNIQVFGSTRPVGFLPWALWRSELQRQEQVISLVDSMWDAFQTRTMWARYGL